MSIYDSISKHDRIFSEVNKYVFNGYKTINVETSNNNWNERRKKEFKSRVKIITLDGGREKNMFDQIFDSENKNTTIFHIEKFNQRFPLILNSIRIISMNFSYIMKPFNG